MQRLPPVKLVLIFLCVIVFLSFINRKNLKDDAVYLIKSLKINIYNLRFLLDPPRRKPINTLSKEMELQRVLKEPFVSFSARDWDEFWNIIYGAYPLESADEEGLAKKYRHLTRVEIQERLMSRFNTFRYYNSEDWEKLLIEMLNIRE